MDNSHLDFNRLDMGLYICYCHIYQLLLTHMYFSYIQMIQKLLCGLVNNPALRHASLDLILRLFVSVGDVYMNIYIYNMYISILDEWSTLC